MCACAGCRGQHGFCEVEIAIRAWCDAVDWQATAPEERREIQNLFFLGILGTIKRGERG